MPSVVINNASAHGNGKLGWASFNDHLRSGYRPDIDGLRAIAVLAVIAYHFHLGPVTGGFTGVDIFFVISGYLITGNIITKLDAGAFNYWDFYQRRIRRIFPALLVILLFTLAVGLSVLREDEAFHVGQSLPFSELYRSVLMGAGFITNFAMLRAGDYFSQTATDQPLLHLWSLAIEEQFYIIWPLLLFGVHALKLRYFPVVVAIAAISFAVNIATVHNDPTLAFYSTLSRAWELMLGAMLACPNARLFSRIPMGGDTRSVLGLVFLLTGLFALGPTTPFPGWAALLPTTGTLLAISAGEKAVGNRYVLAAKPMVWIGLISYPLYLWHWPALLLFEKWSASFPPHSFERPLARTLTLACVAAASWLTFRYIEIPFRFGRGRAPFYAVALLLLMGAVGALSEVALKTEWSPVSLSSYQRETLSQLAKTSELKDLDKLYGERPCFKYHSSDTAALFVQNNCFQITYPGAKTVFLIGDSHSASLSLGLRPLLERERINFLQVSTGFCEPTSNNESVYACDDINKLAANKIAELKPDVVVIDSYWGMAAQPPYFLGSGDYFSALLAKLEDIRKSGVTRIFVVGQIPIWIPSLPETLAQNFVRNNLTIPQRTFKGIDHGSLQMDTKMRGIEFPTGVVYLSLKDLLCDETGCLTAVGPNLEEDLTVWDYGHLTPAASSFVTRSMIAPALAGMVPLK
jgi:peptidoglycan/LPS O-acetylase OafA/YrhL